MREEKMAFIGNKGRKKNSHGKSEDRGKILRGED